MGTVKKYDLTNLVDLKESRHEEIDIKTGMLISAGFSFGGKTFSLSSNARENWDSIKTSKSDYSFPLDISTKNNDTYSLSTSDVQAFWTAARDAVKGHLDTGRIKNKSIFDAADIAAVNLITDDR